MATHLNTKKHKHALIRQANSLKQQQELAVAGTIGDVERFSSPHPDPLVQCSPQNVFHNARLVDNTRLDEHGNEIQLPMTVMEDESWMSQRAQDFRRDIEAGRSHKAPPDDLWGFASDDEDPSSDDEATGCEMPTLTTSNSGDFAPYSSKTVSNCLLMNQTALTIILTQMYVLDLLDSMPRLRLSGAIMKSILWALKELDVPDVPSFRQLRRVQTALAQKIDISPSRHNSAMGNIFYQNSLGALLALVRNVCYFL